MITDLGVTVGGRNWYTFGSKLMGDLLLAGLDLNAMLSGIGQNVAVQLDDAYRILDVPPSASEEEVKNAHRDLTKVWHPDRFAHDPEMHRKAEEKLKLINEAFDTIRSGERRTWRATQAPPAGEPSRKERFTRLLIWLFACVFLALFILARRPTPGGLLVAAVLFVLAGAVIRRMGRLEKGS